MDATGDTGKLTAPERATTPKAQAATPAPHPASDHPFGPDGVELVLAMNRLRHAYLQIAPALAPYLSTGHHDDEPGLAASY